MGDYSCLQHMPLNLQGKTINGLRSGVRTFLHLQGPVQAGQQDTVTF